MRLKGSVVISLPVRVQRELGSFKKYGVKSDDTKVVMIEFKAFQKKLVVDDANTSITF